MSHATRTADLVVMLGLLALAGVAVAVPAQAAQSSSFAVAPIVISAAPNWVPNPIGTNVLGPPDDNCIATSDQPGNDWVEVRFSFAIPPGDVIHGIELKVKYFEVNGATAQLTKGGGLVGATRAVPAFLNSGNVSCNGTVVVTAGGPADLWGDSWSAADLNGGNVGVRVTQIGAEMDIDSIEMVVYHGNSPPTADAGGPYSVNEGGSVVLSGAASSDPDGDALTYAWDLDDNGTFETPGITPTFSAAAIDGPATRTVRLRVTDPDGESSTDTATVNVLNVAPSVAAANGIVTVNEGSTATNTGTFSDPAPADVVTVSASTGTLLQGAATWSWSRPAGDGPSTLFVTITATDDDGGSSTASFTVEVQNLPPVISTVTNTGPIAEGGTATIAVSATDPGGDPLTYTYNCGNGTPPFLSGASAACTYGDDGSYTVTVEVADDDGGVSAASTVVAVTNVAPTPILDTAGAVSFPGGDAFMGRKGVEQSHAAQASDPGSDDLTFSWFGGGAVHTYFNDTGSPLGTPDPDPSPAGTFPFAAADTASVVFTAPGVYTVTVDVADDDGGVASDSLAKLVTDDRECVIGEEHWRKRFRDGDSAGPGHDGDGLGHGHHAHIDDATLQAYLDLIDFVSGFFSERVAASTLAEAAAVFELKTVQGSSTRADAVREALAAWLNFASGAIGLDEPIDAVPPHNGPDTPFLTVIQAVEAILLNPAASDADVRAARDMAKAINRQGNPAHCD
jgi:hypothetical protein